MKNILIFNDISGLGNCSLLANLPIFAKLGHYAMPVVTASFSCQTGFSAFTCQPNFALTKSVCEILQNRTPDAVYTGFCANENLLSEVTDAVQKLDGCYVFVDPVLGDNGKLYSVFNSEYLARMKQLVALADCISPNLTEACLLADVDYQALAAEENQPGFLGNCGKALSHLLTKTGAKSAVVTGIRCGQMMGNIVMDGKGVFFVTNDRVDVNYSGTGDVFSSVLLGEILNGADLKLATQVAANFVAKAAQSTACSDRRFGVEFCRVLDLL